MWPCILTVLGATSSTSLSSGSQARCWCCGAGGGNPFSASWLLVSATLLSWDHVAICACPFLCLFWKGVYDGNPGESFISQFLIYPYLQRPLPRKERTRFWRFGRAALGPVFSLLASSSAVISTNWCGQCSADLTEVVSGRHFALERRWVKKHLGILSCRPVPPGQTGAWPREGLNPLRRNASELDSTKARRNTGMVT